MNRFALAGLAIQLCMATAVAQSTETPPVTTMAPSSQTARPAINSTDQPNTSTVMPRSPSPMARPGGAPGVNSFTESQARNRLVKQGYSRVSGLINGVGGIWRGSAMTNGGSVQVGVDYKGNISMN